MSKRKQWYRTTRRRLMEFLGQRDGQGWACYYCGTPLIPLGIPNQPNSPTIDHIVSVRHGGSDKVDNLRLACYQCNILKGTMDAKVFYAYMRLHHLIVSLRGEDCVDFTDYFGGFPSVIIASEPLSTADLQERATRLARAKW